MQADSAIIDRAVQNVARGLYFSSTKRLLPDGCEIGVIPLDNSNVQKYGPFIASLGRTESFGDDVFRYKFEDEPGMMVCVLDFYRAIRFLCIADWQSSIAPN